MEIIIDDIQKRLIINTYTGEKIVPLYSKEAFEIILKQWLTVGWNQKYVYIFSRMGQGYNSLARSIFENHKMNSLFITVRSPI